MAGCCDFPRVACPQVLLLCTFSNVGACVHIFALGKLAFSCNSAFLLALDLVFVQRDFNLPTLYPCVIRLPQADMRGWALMCMQQEDKALRNFSGKAKNAS